MLVFAPGPRFHRKEANEKGFISGGLFEWKMEDTTTEHTPSSKANPFPWSFQRKQRFVKPDDEFFHDGNMACFTEAKHIVQEEELDQISKMLSNTDIKHPDEILTCDVQGCKETFKTTKAFELHHSNAHKFTCEECKRNFPSNFLLDIHLTETHDTMFDIRIERGEAAFVCLVEACAERFKNEKARLKHLIEEHKYPSDFRFNKKPRERKKKEAKKGTDKSISDISLESIDREESEMKVEQEIACELNGNVQDDANIDKRKIEVKSKGVPRTINFGHRGSKTFHTRPRRGKK
eukprot:Seg1509.4 transcript_id=Seg1509.4/GoldUCD/mRNA.D3Y31 product="Zinc finger protein 511" protein_id=Seg1509.4/GoldUCD/D3Y31